jgi:hypothetical protein
MKKILIIIGLIFILAVVFVYPHLMISPGKLNTVHNEINRNCTACHQPFLGIPSKNCISCHSIDRIGKDTSGKTINEKVLFHKELQTQNCLSCHTEHKGINGDLTDKPFNHSLLLNNNSNNCVSCHPSPTDGLHQNVSNTSCSSCHSTQNWKTDQFNHNLLSDQILNKCVSCHASPKDSYHSNVNSQNCKECHSTKAWKPSTFDHNKYFVFDKHHKNTCTDCHVTQDYKKYTCTSCHEHNSAELKAEHNEEGIYNISNCVECHKSGNEHDIIYNRKGKNTENSKEVINYMKNKRIENDD